MYLPGKHIMFEAPVVSEHAMPAGHSVHAVSPPTEKKPGSQATGVVEVASAQ